MNEVKHAKKEGVSQSDHFTACLQVLPITNYPHVFIFFFVYIINYA